MHEGSYGNTYRQDGSSEDHQELWYNHQTPFKTSKKLNRDSLDTLTQNFYSCLTPIQSNTRNGQSSDKNGKHVRLVCPHHLGGPTDTKGESNQLGCYERSEMEERGGKICWGRK